MPYYTMNKLRRQQMKARKDIERRIEKENQRITDLRSQIERGEAFIQGLHEALKMLPKDENNSKPRKGKGALRAGSDMAKIRDLIQQAGKAMYISDLVTGLGKPNTKANRLSIASSLSRYVRANEIFKRVKPSTFALRDMEDLPEVELPPDFGAEEIGK
jgi:hypothetical protein